MFSNEAPEHTILTPKDLVADTLGAEELDTAYSRVRQIAVEMNDVITTMFGGRGGNSDAGESGFAVWNLSLDDAISLGRRFRQEAIFMVTETDLHLLSMSDSSVELISQRRD